MSRVGRGRGAKGCVEAHRASAAFPLVLIAVLGLLGTAPGEAASFTPISDLSLVRQSPVVVQAAVLASEPAPVPSTPSTDTFVQVEKVLKGYVAGSTVVVRVPGGIGPSGVGLQVWGAPAFRPGERVLLFLDPRSDGTYSVLHLALGVFHEVEAGGRTLAVRHLVGAAELEPSRDFAAFALWLSEAADAGPATKPGEYLVRVEPPFSRALEAAAGPVTEPCTGLGLRWFDFDRDRGVKWWIDPRGTVGAGGLDHARAIWRDASGARVRFGKAGETWSRRGLAAPDGLNTVLFEDPGSWIPGGYDCTEGGMLAVTGVWFDTGMDQECRVLGAGRKGVHDGRPYLEILGADIVTNDGSACHLAAGPMAASEVFSHGLGHALGLADAPRPESLMYGPASDGSTPPLPSAGDLEALRRLYSPRR